MLSTLLINPLTQVTCLEEGTTQDVRDRLLVFKYLEINNLRMRFFVVVLKFYDKVVL